MYSLLKWSLFRGELLVLGSVISQQKIALANLEVQGCKIIEKRPLALLGEQILRKTMAFMSKKH